MHLHVDDFDSIKGVQTVFPDAQFGTEQGLDLLRGAILHQFPKFFFINSRLPQHFIK